MRNGDDAGRAKERVVWKVGDVAANAPHGERGEHCLAVDQSAAREVDDARAALDTVEQRAVEHIVGRVGQGHVNGDVIALGNEFFKIRLAPDGAGQIPGVFDADERVVPGDVHAQRARVVGDHDADRPQADDARASYP